MHDKKINEKPGFDIPYKCSLFVEIENLKIFDFNYFCKSLSKLLFFDVYFNPQRSYNVKHNMKRIPVSGALKKTLISKLGKRFKLGKLIFINL